MISRKYKINSMYLKERLLISLNPQKFFLARTNAKSHGLFIWVMFNSFGSVKTVFSFSEHRNLVNIRRRIIILVELSTISSLNYAFSLSLGTALVCLLHIVIYVNVSPGHQRDRKMSENSISVCKTLLLSLTLI